MPTLLRRLRPTPRTAPPGPTGPSPQIPPFPVTPSSPPPLGVDPASIIYTDASLKRGGPLGCGVYDASNGRKYSYRAQGPVLYGELLAILVALTLRAPDLPVHILSDSLIGLLLINRAVFFAASVSTHAHARLLQAIASRLLSRTAPTTLGKVRGHSGVAGNEQADTCANDGTADGAPPVPDDVLPPPGDGGGGEGGRPYLHIPAGDHGQPVAMDDESPADDGPSEPDDDTAEDADAPAAVPPDPVALPQMNPAQSLSDDILSRLSKLLVRRRALQPAEKQTAQRLQRLFGPELDRVALKPSMYFTTAAAKVTEKARTLCLKLRYNAVYCGWKQHKSNQAPNPNCKLCGRFDHDMHPIGDCTHPQINRMNIQTHNDGGQKILAALKKVSNCAIIANLGNGEAAAHAHTLPSWLGLQSRQAPDILLIKGWTQQRLDAGEFPTSPGDKKQVTLLFIEYKTCSDFKFDETSERIWRKYTPHAGCPRPHRRHLFWELRRLGWTVEGLNAAGELGTAPPHDRMLPVLVGHAGFILQATVNTVFKGALGLSRQASHKLACALNVHQVASASRVFGTAASLKRLGPDGPTAAVAANNTAPASRAPSARRQPAHATGVG